MSQREVLFLMEKVKMETNNVQMTGTETDFTTNLVERLIASEVKLAKEELKSAAETQRELKADYGKFYSALAQAQANFCIPKKSKTAKIVTKKGGDYSYQYATLSDILSATIPHLNKEGIFFSQSEKYVNNGNSCFVCVVSSLYYSNGLTIEHETAPQAYNINDPRDARATITFLRRYGASNILGVEAEEDTDGYKGNGNNFQSYSSNKPNDKRTVNKKSTYNNVNREEALNNNATNSNTTTRKTQNEYQNYQDRSTQNVTKNDTSNTVNNVKPVTNTNKNLQALISSGLSAAKEAGATKEQLSDWSNMNDKNAVLKELSSFVRSSVNKKKVDIEEDSL